MSQGAPAPLVAPTRAGDRAHGEGCSPASFSRACYERRCTQKTVSSLGVRRPGVSRRWWTQSCPQGLRMVPRRWLCRNRQRRPRLQGPQVPPPPAWRTRRRRRWKESKRGSGGHGPLRRRSSERRECRSSSGFLMDRSRRKRKKRRKKLPKSSSSRHRPSSRTVHTLDILPAALRCWLFPVECLGVACRVHIVGPSGSGLLAHLNFRHFFGSTVDTVHASVFGGFGPRIPRSIRGLPRFLTARCFRQSLFGVFVDYQRSTGCWTGLGDEFRESFFEFSVYGLTVDTGACVRLRVYAEFHVFLRAGVFEVDSCPALRREWSACTVDAPVACPRWFHLESGHHFSALYLAATGAVTVSPEEYRVVDLSGR